MTNKEAIERLQKCQRNLEFGKVIGAVCEEGADERIEAYELAIKALKKVDALKEQVKEEFCKSRCPMRDDENYCNPNCAARLFMNIIDNAQEKEADND